MRKTIYLFAFLTGLATAAIQPTGPVYRSASVVNSSPLKQQPNQQQQQQPNLQQQQQLVLTQQPAAEERESTSFQTAESVAKPTVGVNPNPNTAATSPNSQTYTILYYPNAHQGQGQYSNGGATGERQYQNTGATQYPNQYQTAGTTSQVYQQPGNTATMDTWTKYRMNDILTGGAALGLVLVGGALLYPKLANAKARALRELSDFKADDASRMVKGVMRALEKYYDLNTKKE